MTTHAQLAARLLREAAVIFRTIHGDEDLCQRLDDFGKLYEQVAGLVEQDPQGEVTVADVTTRGDHP